MCCLGPTQGVILVPTSLLANDIATVKTGNGNLSGCEDNFNVSLCHVCPQL